MNLPQRKPSEGHLSPEENGKRGMREAAGMDSLPNTYSKNIAQAQLKCIRNDRQLKIS